MTWFPSEIVDNRLHKSVSCETLTSELSTAGKTTQSIGDVFPVAFGCFNWLLLFLSLYLSDRLSSDREKGSYPPTRSVFNCFVCIEERRAAKAVLFYWFSVFTVYLLLKLSEFLTFSLFFSAGKSVAGHFCKHTLVVTVFFSDIYAHNFFAPLCAILLAFYKCNCRRTACTRAELLYNVILL